TVAAEVCAGRRRPTYPGSIPRRERAARPPRQSPRPRRTSAHQDSHRLGGGGGGRPRPGGGGGGRGGGARGGGRGRARPARGGSAGRDGCGPVGRGARPRGPVRAPRRGRPVGVRSPP